jgi:hypothetical protein
MNNPILVLAVLAIATSCDPSPSPSAPPTFVAGSNCPLQNPDGSPASPYVPSPPGTNGPAVGQAIAEMPHNHVTFPAKVGYSHNPPTSGCHYSMPGQAPVSPGAYNQIIAPEFWVHNLEHGYIVILYNCPGGQYGVNGCLDDFNQLVSWMRQQPKDPGGLVAYAKIEVIPDADMPVKFAAVSWDWYQGWSTLDITAINAFYQNHVGRSPEGPSTS